MNFSFLFSQKKIAFLSALLLLFSSFAVAAQPVQAANLEMPLASTSVTFNYTGSLQTWTVPTGVSSVYVQVYGAGGNTLPSGKQQGTGGAGGYSYGTVNVTAGQVYEIVVGQKGSGTTSYVAYGGGGSYGGAGRSEFKKQGDVASNAIIAGGGGGGANNGTGGAGGGGNNAGGNATYGYTAYGGHDGIGGAGNSGASNYSNGQNGGTVNGGNGSTGGGGGGGGGYGGGGAGGIYRSGKYTYSESGAGGGGHTVAGGGGTVGGGAAKNTDGWVVLTYTVVTDVTAPALTTSLAPTTWTNSTVTATVNATDAESGVAHVYCKTNSDADYTDGGVSSCSRPFTTNGTFSYYAVDNVGNSNGTSNSPLTLAVSNIDKTNPTATTNLTPSAWTSGSITATVNASDADSGVTHVYCKLAGDVSYTDGGTTTCNKTATQNDILSYYITDTAGNSYGTSGSPLTLAISNIDKTNPVLSVSHTPETLTNGTVSITATATDVAGSGVAHVYCKLSGDADYTDGGNSSCVRTATQNVTFSYYAVDNVGNSNGTAVSPLTAVISNIDITPPTNPGTILATNGLVSGVWQSTINNPSFSWLGAGDNVGLAGYEVYWGQDANATSGNFQAGNSFVPGTVTAGDYYLRLRTKDTAGNYATWFTAFNFRYDAGSPSQPAGSGGNSAWQNTNNTPSFTWSPADGGVSGLAGYEVYWGSNSNATSGTFQVSNTFAPGTVADGNYYLRVRSKNNAGVYSDWVTIDNFRYDGTAPTNPTTVTETHGVITNVAQNADLIPAFSWNAGTDNASGVAYYELRLDTNGVTGESVIAMETSQSFAAVAEATTSELYLRTYDEAGNASQWQKVFTFITASSAPSEVTSVTITPNTISNNVWQKISAAPTFSWNAAANATSYEVYFGTDSAATTGAAQLTTSYTPTAVATGTYYLRIRSQNSSNVYSNWNTVFTLKYDNSNPAYVSTATETHGVQGGVSQSTVNQPSFTWNAPTDTGSGIVGYNVYFGILPSGTSTTFVGSAAYTVPAPVSSTELHYFRVQAVDGAGNTSAWRSVFVFSYLPPVVANVSTATESHGYQNNSWRPNNQNQPTYTWSAPNGSIAGYNVYFGNDINGTNGNYQTGLSFTPSPITTTGTYYLRIQSKDTNNNTSAWQTVSTFNYDADAPAAVAYPVTETHGTTNNICQDTNRQPAFSWLKPADLGSGVSGYNVYFGKNINEVVTGEISTVTGDGFALNSPVDGGLYALWLQSKDAVDNVSDWQIGYMYCFASAAGYVTDNTPLTLTATLASDPDGQLVVSLPAALHEDELQVLIYPAKEQITAPAQFSAVGNQFEIEAISQTTGDNVTQFNKEYTISYHYTDAEVSGLDETTLKVYYHNPQTGEWEVLPTSTVDTVNNIVSATVNHMSDFAIFGTVAVGDATITILSGGAPNVIDSLVTFEAKTLTGSIQQSDATLAAPWVAKDPSGSGQGWHVEITATDFISGSHAIAVANAQVKQQDAMIALVAGNAVPTSAQTTFTSLGMTPVKLLTAALNTGMGTYQFSPEFTLTIPAATFAGTYVAPVTLSIITAP